MMARRVFGWLGWAGLEAVSRIALLLGSTAIFSRYLEAHDFGAVAIVVVAVTLAAIFVGIPFEQPLAQHVGLQRQHVETAFAASCLVSAVMVLASIPAGALVATAYDEPAIALLMPAAALSLFFSGYSDVLRGVARRQRRFNDIAIASLVGHAAGIAIALVLLFCGFGVWALLAQRLLVVVFQAFAMGALAGFALKPSLSRPHLMDLRRYAGLQLFDRLAESINYFAFNYIVAHLYSLTVLGHVNMALRVVEPIRGAVIATAHNVAFYYFTVAGARDGAGRSGHNVLWRSALASSPLFFGLAAVLPVLLPILVGPGWEPAIGIAIFLSIGSAFYLPSRLVFTALAADARPEYGVMSNIAGAIATILVLVAAASLSPIVVGIARAAGDLAQAALAILLPQRIVGWPRMARFSALMPGWLFSGGMALVVAAFAALWGGSHALLALVLSIALGVAIYGLVLTICAKDFLREVVQGVTGGPRA